jgi:hypothetical protein
MDYNWDIEGKKSQLLTNYQNPMAHLSGAVRTRCAVMFLGPGDLWPRQSCQFTKATKAAIRFWRRFSKTPMGTTK